jgi:uncharacterized protein (TIGR00369 family)
MKTKPIINAEEPKNPKFVDFVTSYVAAQGFLSSIHATIEELAVGKVTLKIPYSASVGQHTGAFHGGVIGALSEAAMGACAATMIQSDQTVVGAEYKVNFLSLAQGETLIAEGEILKAGRSLSVCRATVLVSQADGSSKVVAVAQGTMANIKADPHNS